MCFRFADYAGDGWFLRGLRERCPANLPEREEMPSHRVSEALWKLRLENWQANVNEKNALGGMRSVSVKPGPSDQDRQDGAVRTVKSHDPQGPVRFGEVWGGLGRFGEVWGGLGRFGKVWPGRDGKPKALMDMDLQPRVASDRMHMSPDSASKPGCVRY
jgi:hypothetical protein